VAAEPPDLPVVDGRARVPARRRVGSGTPGLRFVTAPGCDDQPDPEQEAVFAELTAGWSAEDVRRFHGYLQRLLDAQRKRR